jgi:V/A-type H+/Na+-transporting ATPase subunit F
MAQIAFIAQDRIFRVFAYFGMDVFLVNTPQEADEKLQELAGDTDREWGIVYLEERLAAELTTQIAALNRAVLPVISVAPSSGDTQGIARDTLQGLVRKVTGVDMSFD